MRTISGGLRNTFEIEVSQYRFVTDLAAARNHRRRQRAQVTAKYEVKLSSCTSYMRYYRMDELDSAFAAARASALAGDLRISIGKLRRRLREEARPGELTASQTAVLGRLERDGPATVTTLARAEGVRSQSMGAIIAALQEASMVTGAPDPTDGRQTLLSLTPACTQIIQATRAAREDWLFDTIRTKLTPAEQDQLAAGVELLKRLAEP